MISSSHLTLLIIIAGIALIWWSSTQAKEIATRYARQCCKTHQLQLLDQTVALKKIKLARNSRGQMAWQREYEFEYTGKEQVDLANVSATDTKHRDRGSIFMSGSQLIRVHLPFVRDEDGNRIYFQ